VKPTVILVHGAFAESASWSSVIDSLISSGHPVIAAANPLRNLAADAASIGDLIRAIEGPVVLVGHSYGGAVISNVPAEAGEITALVYVAAFAPDPGESCISLAGRFPGSTLGEALQSVPRGDGTTDLAIVRERFHNQFCADLTAQLAERMAVIQRPVTQEALAAPSGARPLWRELPSWFVIPEEDRNIPAELQRFMAERANARRTLEIPGASHAVAVSHPQATTELILEAVALAAGDEYTRGDSTEATK
jgi:pimeloyl-ACP methyl ester carboxylesterase